MLFHRLFQFCFCWALEIREGSVQCIKLMKVPMPADGRARASKTCSFPVIQSLQCAFRKILLRDALGQGNRCCWDIVKDPMYPGHSWIGRVRSVRIINNQCKASGTSDHVNAGEISCPSHVCLLGISPLFSKFGDCNFMARFTSFPPFANYIK